jgi:hypothetical protein
LFPRNVKSVFKPVSRAGICKRLRSPGIDSKESIPPAYVAWRAGTSNEVVVPALQAGNRFLGSKKVYKFGLSDLSLLIGYLWFKKSIKTLMVLLEKCCLFLARSFSQTK